MSHDPHYENRSEIDSESSIDKEIDSDDSHHGSSYDTEQLRRIVEGAILAAGEALTVDKLHSLFEEYEAPEKSAIRNILQDIARSCEGRGFQLVEVASGWRFQVREDVATWVNRLWDEKPQKYSRAMLETLALIAYRQPITRGDIEDVRGVAVSSHIIKTLVEREWVKIVGHRDVPGRPSLYATTRQFLDYFNLKSLDELPTLSELKDIDSPNGSLDWGDGVSDGDASEGKPETPSDQDPSEEVGEEHRQGLPDINEELLDQSLLDDSASEVSDEEIDLDSSAGSDDQTPSGNDFVEVKAVEIPLQFDQDKTLPNPILTEGEPLMAEAEATIEQVEFAEAKRKREAEEKTHEAARQGESDAENPSPNNDAKEPAEAEKTNSDDQRDYSAGSLFSNTRASDEDADDHTQKSPDGPANEHQ
jgi:segregation and condensation protein B